jgi:hypothetical protein
MVHSNAENIILLLVDTHWGEVDWILPVLHKIREKKKDIKLVAIFSSKKLFDKRKTQLTLYNSLCKYTDEVIYPNPKNIIVRRRKSTQPRSSRKQAVTAVTARHFQPESRSLPW